MNYTFLRVAQRTREREREIMLFSDYTERCVQIVVSVVIGIWQLLSFIPIRRPSLSLYMSLLKIPNVMSWAFAIWRITRVRCSKDSLILLCWWPNAKHFKIINRVCLLQKALMSNVIKEANDEVKNMVEK